MISHSQRSRISILFASVSLSIALAAAAMAGGAPAQATFELSGTVTGASGKHAVYVALWSADNFLKKPTEQQRFDLGTGPTFHFQIPAGHWALSAFEDMNDNGVLDMGLFGPKEPSGFWRAFHGHHKPRFSDVQVEITQDTRGADIALSR